ncbi:MAG: hypothetical protein MN733_01095 [Nitrososphaera sp.]|nr:hypothetical protein [Nitrososphaera sp.]
MKSMIIAATLAVSVTTANALESFEQMQTRLQLWQLQDQLDNIRSVQRRAASPPPVYIIPPRPVRPLPWETIRPGPGGCYGCDQ